jgi:hypothetical protein
MQCRARQVAEHQPQRVLRADLIIAEGDDDHGARALNASPEEFQELEGGLVRPMHVFEHGQGTRLRQFVQGSAEDGVATGLRVEYARQRTGRLSRHVEQRGEGLRGEQRIAGSPQHTSGGKLRGEALQQRSLADAGFSAHQHHASRCAFGGSKPGDQLGELLFAF